MTGAACRAVVVAQAGPGGVHWLDITLVNGGAEPVELVTEEPFTAFSLVAADEAGAPVAVHVPALDIGIRPVTLRLEPGATVPLPTPIRLRLAAGAAPVEDRFTWTVDHDPPGLTLALRLQLPPPFDLECPVTLT